MALTGLALTTACEKPKETTAAPSAKPTVKKPAAPAEPKGMPAVTVDSMGPYINGERMKMKEKGGPEKLTRVVGELPIDGKQVDLVVLKKATTPDVVAVVVELGKAGAPTVNIKTEGREGLPKEIVVTPPGKVTDPEGCSVTVMVLDDLSTAVWPLKGATGRKHRKGFAGPDLSNTAETITKEIEKCSSSVAYFSSDDSIPWQMAFNLAGTLLQADEEKKVQTLVLLPEAPVAGRKVEKF